LANYHRTLAATAIENITTLEIFKCAYLFWENVSNFGNTVTWTVNRIQFEASIHRAFKLVL